MSMVPFNIGKFTSRGRGTHPVRRIDTDELILVVNGELRMFEEERTFDLRPGEWLILRRGRRHGGMAAYPGNLSFFWLHFLDEDGLLEMLPQQGRAADAGILGNYLQNYRVEQDRPHPDMEIRMLLLQLIFAELRRSPELAVSAVSPLVLAARQQIELKFAEVLTVATLSRQLGCNAEYLGRAFHSTYHETVSSAINRTRLEYAAKLLTESALSVKEVMSLSGFNDPAYFRRQFKAFYQTTPAKYRSRSRLGHRNTE